VNDELRSLVDVGTAVDADQASSAVVVALPDGRIDMRGRTGSGNDADPGFVGQDRIGFSGEDGLSEAVGDIPRVRVGIPIKRPVDNVVVDFRAKRDRLRNREIDRIRSRAIPGRVLTRVDRVMAMRKKDGRAEWGGILRVLVGASRVLRDRKPVAAARRRRAEVPRYFGLDDRRIFCRPARQV
jgi:hypothetical protein